MRWFVDPWDRGYGTSVEQHDDLPDRSDRVDPTPERPADAWQPLDAPGGLRAPDVIYLVDGVRRDDALLWSAEDTGDSLPGLAASYAAGVVRCDLRRGRAELAGHAVRRGLFTPSPQAVDLVARDIRYAVHRVDLTDVNRLRQAVQNPMTGLEVEISERARQTAGDDNDLLVVDGQLRERHHLPRAIGYIKTQHGRYLPPDLVAVVVALRAGQRSPVFLIDIKWRRFTWYLRLPTPSRAPWAGIVRVECSAELTAQEAIALADLSAVTLPRFASTPYKDPRAPQNLVPIAGLERRLRALLGDPRLLHRALTVATSRAAAAVP